MASISGYLYYLLDHNQHTLNVCCLESTKEDCWSCDIVLWIIWVYGLTR